MRFNALSLFSSAGVAETYFDQHGVTVKTACELLPERVKIYRHYIRRSIWSKAILPILEYLIG